MIEQQTPTDLSSSLSEPTELSSSLSELSSSLSEENRTAQSKKISTKSAVACIEESVDLSLISEITEENLNEDSFLLEEPSSITLLQPEKKSDTGEDSSSNCVDVCEFEKFTFKPDEVLTLDNADPWYKKLRDEIVEYVLHDLKCDALPEEGIQMRSQPQVLSGNKKAFMFLSVILFIAVLAVVFFTPDDDHPLVPT